MKETDYVRVCPLSEVPAGEGRGYQVEGYDLAVFNVGSEILVIENRCPHMGAELGDGELVDRQVCCGEHGWAIDLDTGAAIGRSADLIATFPAKVVEGEIWVQLG